MGSNLDPCPQHSSIKKENFNCFHFDSMGTLHIFSRNNRKNVERMLNIFFTDLFVLFSQHYLVNMVFVSIENISFCELL